VGSVLLLSFALLLRSSLSQACLKISFFRFPQLHHKISHNATRHGRADIKRHEQGRTALSRHAAKGSTGYAPPLNQCFTHASVFAPWNSVMNRSGSRKKGLVAFANEKGRRQHGGP